MPKITYCVLTLNRLSALKKAIRHTAPFVDRTIVIDGCSWDGTIEYLQSQECKDLGVEHRLIPQKLYQYGNHNPDKRNPYIELAGPDGWLLVMDDDEYLYPDALKQLSKLADQAEFLGYDGIKFRPHDIWTMEDGTVRDIKHENYYSPMFWKSYPGQHYDGHTHVRIVRPGAKDNWMETPYFYQHIKDEKRLWRNSTQNYWTTVGLAANADGTDPIWLGFHDLMKKYHYLDWHLFDTVMTAGEVPKEIVDWFIEHRNADNPEERSWFVWYLKILHPELNTSCYINRDG